MKKCSKCGESKMLDEFYKDKQNKDGRSGHCKECTIAQSKSWREANPEKVKAQQKSWREANREKEKARQKAWYEANREKAKARSKAYYETSPEKVKAQLKIYYATEKGDMPKASELSCASCGNPADHYHHWSYKKKHWFDVIPVCRCCHQSIHAGNIDDQELR